MAAGAQQTECERIEELRQAGDFAAVWELIAKRVHDWAHAVSPEVDAEGAAYSVKREIKQSPEGCVKFLEWAERAAKRNAEEQLRYKRLLTRARRLLRDASDEDAGAALMELWGLVQKFVDGIINSQGIQFSDNQAQAVRDHVLDQLGKKPPEWQGLGQFFGWVKTVATRKVTDVRRQSEVVPSPVHSPDVKKSDKAEPADPAPEPDSGEHRAIQFAIRWVLSDVRYAHQVLCWIANKLLTYEPRKIVECARIPLQQWFEERGGPRTYSTRAGKKEPDGLAKQCFRIASGADLATWDKWFKALRARMEDKGPNGRKIGDTCLADYLGYDPAVNPTAGIAAGRSVTQWVDQVVNRMVLAGEKDLDLIWDAGERPPTKDLRKDLPDKLNETPPDKPYRLSLSHVDAPHKTICWLARRVLLWTAEGILLKIDSELAEWLDAMALECPKQTRLKEPLLWEELLEPLRAAMANQPAQGTYRGEGVEVGKTCLQDYAEGDGPVLGHQSEMKARETIDLWVNQIDDRRASGNTG